MQDPRSLPRTLLPEHMRHCWVCGVTNADFRIRRENIVPWIYNLTALGEAKGWDVSKLDINAFCCSKCHVENNLNCWSLVDQIADEQNVRPCSRKLKAIIRCGRAIRKHKHRVEPARQQRFAAVLLKYFEKDKLTEDDIKKAARLGKIHKRIDEEKHGKEVMQQVAESYEALQEFASRWHTFFMRHMKPQHWPEPETVSIPSTLIVDLDKYKDEIDDLTDLSIFSSEEAVLPNRKPGREEIEAKRRERAVKKAEKQKLRPLSNTAQEAKEIKRAEPAFVTEQGPVMVKSSASIAPESSATWSVVDLTASTPANVRSYQSFLL